ncbi:MAG: DegT/DnrJ/EryC1/StrS family aminotransferase [Cyclobacteriaceae bacterium]
MQYEDVTPVFVDIEEETLGIDPELIPSAITQRTKAILPVHVFGHVCKIPETCEIARDHDLAVIEVACEALRAKIGNTYAGTFGDVGTFGFYPNKQITTGEGGMFSD